MTAPARDEYEGRGRFAGGMLGRLLSFAVPHKRLLISALTFFPLVAGLQLLQPYLLKLAIDGPIREGRVDALFAYAAVFLGLVFLQGAAQLVQTVLMQLAGQRIMRDIRSLLFRRVLALAPSYFDRTPLGKILTRLTGDVEALNEFLSSGLVSVIADTVLLIGILCVMLLLDAQLALVSCAFVLPLVAGLAWLRGRLRQVFRAVRNRSTAVNAFLQEHVVGMTIVQAFAAEERTGARHEELTEGQLEEEMRSLWLSSLLSAGVQLAHTLTLALLLWVTLGETLGDAVTVGLVVAFVDYISRFYGPIENLSGRFAILQTAMASAEKIFTILDEDELLDEPSEPRSMSGLDQGLRLEDVRFRYREGEEVLRGVSFDVPRGQTVALVGATGAGKSTIVKLLGRFYDPTAGSVLWDGEDLRSFRSRDLRQRIAFVPQETFLFSDALQRNIALDPERVTQEAMRAAAEAVGADRVARQLPAGYQQVLGERGQDLSAGERQLISFARALAHDPDVLILDEATAHVDGETEARLQQALDTLLKGRTAVVIAHRLSTVKKADRIIVLHKGRVVEQGTHDELLAARGLYWKLYRLQSEEILQG